MDHPRIGRAIRSRENSKTSEYLKPRSCVDEITQTLWQLGVLCLTFYALIAYGVFLFGAGRKVMQAVPGFPLRLLWCSQSGDNPENALAKFGFILHKSRKKTESLCILGYLLGTCHKKFGYWGNNAFEIWWIWAMENRLYKSKSYF